MKPKNGLDSYKSTLTDAEIATLFEVPVQEDFNLGFLDPASLNLNVDFTSETPKTQQSMAIAVRAASAEHPIPAASGTDTLLGKHVQPMSTFSYTTTHSSTTTLSLTQSTEPTKPVATKRRKDIGGVDEDNRTERASKRKAREHITFSFRTDADTPELHAASLTKTSPATQRAEPSKKARTKEQATPEDPTKEKHRLDAKRNRAIRKQREQDSKAYCEELGKTNAEILTEIGLLRAKRAELMTALREAKYDFTLQGGGERTLT